MIKFRKILLGSFGVFLLVALPIAQAQNTAGPNSEPSKGHYGQRIQEIYNQLNLTDDQKKQLDVIKQQHRARTKNARQEMKKDKEALKDELMNAQLDMPKVKKLHEQIKALMSQMEDDKLNSILAVRAILTPDQFLKFVDLMHKHKQDHGR